MKLSRSDFQLMRFNIAAISISVLLSGILIYGSQQFAYRTGNELRTAQSQLKDARNRLSVARQDQENLSSYAIEYDALEKQNIIGDDNRLDWMEGLGKLRNQNFVLGFRYNIAPQKIYSPQPVVDSGNFNLNYSEMKLQFDLLHEVQLLNFFDALHHQIKGHYQLDGCSMKHVATDENSNMDTITHITAECDGGWITLKNRNAPQ
jgi:hypothetical protein